MNNSESTDSIWRLKVRSEDPDFWDHLLILSHFIWNLEIIGKFKDLEKQEDVTCKMKKKWLRFWTTVCSEDKGTKRLICLFASYAKDICG